MRFSMAKRRMRLHVRVDGRYGGKSVDSQPKCAGPCFLPTVLYSA